MTESFDTALFGGDAPREGDAGAIRFRIFRDAGDIVNVVFRFVRETAGELFRALVVIVGPVSVVAALVGYVVQRRMMANLATMATMAPDDVAGQLGEIFTLPYFASMLLGLVAPLLLTAATVAYARLYRQGEAGTISPAHVWAETRSLLRPAVLTILVVLLGFVGLVVLNIIPCLGTLFALGLGIYLFPVLSLMAVVAMEESTGPGAAWSRSREIVRGRWGTAFGAVFLTSLIVFVAGFALTLLLVIPAMVAGMSGTSAETAMGSPAVLAVLSALTPLATLLYVFPVLGTVFLYHTLAERHDGTGLEDAVVHLAGDDRADGEAFGRPTTPPTYAPEAPAMDESGPYAAGPDARADMDAPTNPDATTPSEAPPTPSSTDTPPTAPRGFRGGGFRDTPDA